MRTLRERNKTTRRKVEQYLTYEDLHDNGIKTKKQFTHPKERDCWLRIPTVEEREIEKEDCFEYSDRMLSDI
jgi:hypothetical protein